MPKSNLHAVSQPEFGHNPLHKLFHSGALKLLVKALKVEVSNLLAHCCGNPPIFCRLGLPRLTALHKPIEI